jgi:hypothetical protein
MRRREFLTFLGAPLLFEKGGEKLQPAAGKHLARSGGVGQAA